MHMQAHITGIQQCPCCTCPDETMDHLISCQHKGLTTKRELLLKKFRRKGLELGIPRAVIEAMSDLLHAHSHGETARLPENPSIAMAVSLQRQIGTHLFFRGFWAKEWKSTLDDFSVQHPDRKLTALLKALWIDYTDQLWRNRNDVTHQRQNNAQQAEDHTWTEKLHWFLRNPQVISQPDQFLLNYTTEDIQHMPSRTRKKLAQNLQTVQTALAQELLQRTHGQTVITSYFARIQSQTSGLRPPSTSTIQGVDTPGIAAVPLQSGLRPLTQ
jgi:hypothetical protein